MADLFHENTTKRMIEESEISPSVKQKKASKKWIELLENHELKEEVANYPRFMNYILKEILGYDILNFKHEEGNMEFAFDDSSGKKLVVFEAKGTKTKDLWAYQGRNVESRKTPVKQVWDYMSRDIIPWGILTNYKEFVIFDRSKSYNDYYKFDFLDIKKNPEKLKEFIKIFSRESLENNFVEKIVKESEIEEKELSKVFYKLFHETRLMMLKEFKERGVLKNKALHYAQLYLNRLMFVFFAEDLGFIKKRILEEMIINSLNNYSNNSSKVSDEIMVLFEDLDKGSSSRGVQQFNGGLFKEKLSRDAYFKDLKNKSFFKGIYFEKKKLNERLKLSEEERKIFDKAKKKDLSPIIENILLMASYDFKSELKVNILGHIFEQSLSDLEELKEENVSKRKKEGIFYTPEYITDYICRNTIIPYLSKSGTNEVDVLIDEYSKDLDVLEEKFHKIKILDPACGSGAFLIKSVDVLFEIFEKIQKLKESYGDYEASKFGKKISGQLNIKKFEEKDVIKDIILNNIYGVDINEESIETTKLSLFLRIAKKGRKLPDLSENIKCGNSLIDDEEVAGDKAFKWEEEFKEIFEDGGFDVVVGNPPYVRQELIKEIKPFLEKNYESYSGTSDLFVYFFEKGLKLLKEKGKFAFIVSNKFTRAGYGKNLRKYLLENTKIKQYIDEFESNKVFEGVTVDPCIIILEKNKVNNSNFILYNYSNKIKQDSFDTNSWSFGDENKIKLIEKIKSSGKRLREIIGEAKSGIKTGLNEVLIVNSEKINSIVGGVKKEKEAFVPFIKGEDIKRWKFEFNDNYLLFLEGKNLGNYSNIKKYLLKNKERLSKRTDIIKTNKKWYELRPCAYYDLYKKPKIVWPDISQTMNFTLDYENNYFNNTSYFLPTDNKYYLVLLNSKVLLFYFDTISSKLGKKGYRFIPQYVHELPIKEISPEEQKPFIEKADLMLDLNKEFYNKKNKFLNRIKELGIDKISKKLNKFYELSFADFLSELEKKKIEFSLKQKDEWEDYFNDYKKDLVKLNEEIDKTDNEIDKMVYSLYGLSEKEIKVVEGSLG